MTTTSKPYYLTAAIPYVNAKPHIGHALEFIQVDTIARYHRLLGKEVVTLCGGDENALKNVQAADAANQPVQEFVDLHNQEFEHLSHALDANFTIWQKGSNRQTHFPSSQHLWQLCQQHGDIYQKEYSGLYCVGCEAFYEPSELDETGQCHEHPGKPLETVTESNYFFRLSRYQQQLTDLITSDTLLITPETRKNEILGFLATPLQDISISRSNQRARNWGVPVPGDDSQRMYVWFDALNIYQSGIGFGWDEPTYQKFWPADLHVIGKGILRFHAVYWPAFLLSAGLKLPRALLVHEYFTVDGQKMSKTLGNVFDPLPVISSLGADALRYYCLAKFSPFSDGDFSLDKLHQAYTSDLANGLGNLVSRVAALCSRSNLTIKPDEHTQLRSAVKQALDSYRFDRALQYIWEQIAATDQLIEHDQPWTLTPTLLQPKLQTYVAHIRQIAFELLPFLPSTATTILTHFQGPSIDKISPLFPRLNH